jgi:hypothetical protein
MWIIKSKEEKMHPEKCINTMEGKDDESRQ